MDRIVKTYLSAFLASNGIEESRESTQFEHFVNYTIIQPMVEELPDIESLNIGGNGNIGIDGFALLINNHLVDSIEEMDDIIGNRGGSATAEVIFIQSKTSGSFSVAEITMFGNAVEDFISEHPGLAWTPVAKEKIKLFQELVIRIPKLKKRPTCSLYYVTLAKTAEALEDQNIKVTVESHRTKLIESGIFADAVGFNLVCMNELISSYTKIGEAISKTFSLEQVLELPQMPNVDSAYIGIATAKSITDLVSSPAGTILPNIFYDNVRDFQGDNPVNSAIAQTLNSVGKSYFAILNNGITIVAESCSITRKECTITNFQIINGCQTSNVLFANKDKLDDTVMVSLKIVVSTNEDLISEAIRSTNNQTAVKPQDLLAYSMFHKNLERYFQTFSGDEKLYYERRSKQYNNDPSVEKKRIIDKTILIKSVCSIYLDKPQLATRYFGTLLDEFNEQLFRENHENFPYYVAAYIYYRLNGLFKTKKISNKYRKIKFHLLMAIRYEIESSSLDKFRKQDEQKYNMILATFKDDSLVLNYINRASCVLDQVISKLGFDIDDSELSKSTSFVAEILRHYKT